MVPLGPWNPRPKLSNSRVNTALGVNNPVPFGPWFRHFELAPGSSRDMRFRTHNLWSGAERGLELTVGLMSTAPRGGNHRVFRQPTGKVWRRTCCRRRSGARRTGWMRCLGEGLGVVRDWPVIASKSRRPFRAHSGENSRGKVQNVVGNCPADFPCIHRGEVLRQVGCGCGARDQKLDVHACRVHGECTIHATGKNGGAGRIRACVGCEGRQA